MHWKAKVQAKFDQIFGFQPLHGYTPQGKSQHFPALGTGTLIISPLKVLGHTKSRIDNSIDNRVIYPKTKKELKEFYLNL